MSTEDADTVMADVSTTEVADSLFDTGNTVLVKVKGYPAWPAVIVGEEDLAPEVLDAKPKKKDVYPVLFYVDNNYSWVSDTEIKELTRERAAQLASGSKKKKALVEAFKIAADPPNYKEYIDVINNPPEIIEEPVAEVDDSMAEEIVEESVVPVVKKARKAADKPPKPVNRSRGQRKRKNGEGDGNEDVTMDDLDIEELDHRIELKARKRGRPSNDKDKNTARDEDFARSSHLRLELCKELRVRLQKGLLDQPPTPATMKKLSSFLKQLEAVPNLEIAFVRQSKINRVLKIAVKLDLPLDSELKFKSRCSKLLEKWNTPAEPLMHGLSQESYEALQAEKARNGIKDDEEGTEEPESEMSIEPSMSAEPPSDADSLDVKPSEEPPKEIKDESPVPEPKSIESEVRTDVKAEPQTAEPPASAATTMALETVAELAGPAEAEPAETVAELAETQPAELAETKSDTAGEAKPAETSA